MWLAYHDQTGMGGVHGHLGFFVISGIDNIVKPLLISRGASLPFVLVLLGVFGGALAFGFVGIFLADAPRGRLQSHPALDRGTVRTAAPLSRQPQV